MILRGRLDQSLGQVCIRGYAYLGDIERVSRPDFGFQRNLIAKQKETMIRFLDNNPNLFFPEVILSYVVKYDFAKRGAKSGIDPLIEIQNKIRFKSNTGNIQFITKKIYLKNKFGSPGIDIINLVSIDIDDEFLNKSIEDKQQPFLRIDGNHRLSAAAEFRERQTVTYMTAPFCLILLPDESPGFGKREATKFEKTVFHNINSKSVRLTDEEIYKVIIDDPVNFTDTELVSRDDFGVEYLFARNIWKKIKPENFPAIEYLLHDKKDEVQFIRTILVDLFTILRDYKLISKRFTQFAFIERIFKKGEQRYEDFPLLQQSNAHGLLIAFLFFTFKNNKFNLDWFTDWVLENHIYELKYVSPYDLIAIFEKILLAKHRSIFISMQFNDPVCENHFDFIKDLVDEINKETKANIKLYPLRIDRYKDGSAYKIPDTILNKIFDSGFTVSRLDKRQSQRLP